MCASAGVRACAPVCVCVCVSVCVPARACVCVCVLQFCFTERLAEKLSSSKPKTVQQGEEIKIETEHDGVWFKMPS